VLGREIERGWLVSGAAARRNSLAGLVETNHCVRVHVAELRPAGNGSSNDAWLGRTADEPPPPTPANPCGAPESVKAEGH